jgi:hypothetical protein
MGPTTTVLLLMSGFFISIYFPKQLSSDGANEFDIQTDKDHGGPFAGDDTPHPFRACNLPKVVHRLCDKG